MRVAKNRWFKARSVEGEYLSTWRHMKERRMPAKTFRDINSQLALYEREGYDMHALYRLPDTFCIGTDVTSALARRFACQIGVEVATRSMREQLSFDHARPPELNVTWWAMNVANQYGNAECVEASAASPQPQPPSSLATRRGLLSRAAAALGLGAKKVERRAAAAVAGALVCAAQWEHDVGGQHGREQAEYGSAHVGRRVSPSDASPSGEW